MVVEFMFPSLVCMLGHSSCGKSSLMVEICNNLDRYFPNDPDIDTVFYFHGTYSEPSGIKNPKVVCIAGIPDVELIKSRENRKTITIIDDHQSFLSTKEGKQLISEFYCVLAHHLNTSIFCLLQGAFETTRLVRTNSTHIFLFRSPSDTLSVKTILSQIFGADFKRAWEAYVLATSEPYGCLLIDNHNKTPSDLRLISDVLSENPITYIART